MSSPSRYRRLAKAISGEMEGPEMRISRRTVFAGCRGAAFGRQVSPRRTFAINFTDPLARTDDNVPQAGQLRKIGFRSRS
jgi:hypothetical protein